MDDPTFLRYLREQLGMSQTALGQLLGLTQTGISRAETGQAPLNPVRRARLEALETLLQKGAVCDPCDRRYPFARYGHRLRYCARCRGPLRPTLCPACYLPLQPEEPLIGCVFCGYDLTASEEGGHSCPSSPSIATPPPST